MTSMPLVERVSFRDSDHSYHLDGKKIPSVTTILGNLSKPALPWWAAKMGAEAVQEYLESLDPGTMIAENAGLASTCFDLAQRAHITKRNAAGARGTVVHDAIEKFHTDFFNAEPPEDEGARKRWEAFIEWWASAGLACISTERKIIDPDQRYAGRLDLLLDADPGLFVCDVKTSGGVYPEFLYQNAAYAHAIEAELECEVMGTKVLWIPEGTDRLIVVERDRTEWLNDFTIFEALIPIHHDRKIIGKWTKEITDTYKKASETE